MAYFKISNQCNLGCFFCSQNCNADNAFVMSLKEGKLFLRKMRNFGVIKIIYTGGEPLLYPHLYDLLSYGKQLGFDQTIVTNGMFLQKMESVLPFISSIGISLHGDENVHNEITGNHNSYNLTINNIIALRDKHKFPVNINYTFNNLNQTESSLSNVKDFCDKYGVKLSVARLNFVGKSKDVPLQNLNELCSIVDNVNKITKTNPIGFSNCIVPCSVSDEFKKYAHGCGAGISFFAMESNGDVKICATSTKSLGNVKNSNLKKIFSNKELTAWKTGNHLHSVCKNCKNVLFCKGGCRVECANEDFSKSVYDSYLIDKIEKAKMNVLKNKILLKSNTVTFSKNKIVIPVAPIRLVHKKYFTLLTMLNGERDGNEILNAISPKKKEETLELLTTMYLEGIIDAKRI